MFPVYSMESTNITVYPSTITSNVTAQYIRLPKDPKWTYTTIVGGSPLFDQSSLDYQDFELPESDEPLLVAKILQYAGISIREVELYNFGTAEETANKQIEG